MIAGLRRSWIALPRRTRLVIAVLALVLVAGLYLYLVLAAQASHSRLRTNVASLRVQAAAVAQQAAEIEGLRIAPVPAAAATDVKVLVGNLLAAAGLSHAVERIDAADGDRVVVVIAAVGFAEWLQWLDSLAAHRLRLDACRIDASSVPGKVGVTATLVRARPS